MESLYITISYDEHSSHGNLIDLPENLLEKYTNENKTFPYFFKIHTSYNSFYVGVCEFSAKDYELKLSPLLAETLLIHENQIIQLEFIENIPFGKYIEIEPLDEHFFQLPDYEDLLEFHLSKFPILFPSQIIAFQENNQIFHIKLLDIQPDWNLINLENQDFENIECFNMIDQNIQVDIHNSFLKKKLLEEKKKLEEKIRFEQEELKKQEKERLFMKHNDYNILSLGVKLSSFSGNCINNSTSLSSEDIRKIRIEKYKKSKK